MGNYDDVEHFDIPSAGADDDELTAELFRSAFRAPNGSQGTTYRWRDMSPQQAESVWAALADWVRWLVATYQLTTSVVPDCWWKHQEIVAELYALQQAEQASYTADDAGFGPLAFHERLPHAVERLRTQTRTAGCVGLQAHKEPTPRILTVDGPEFIAWQAAHHQLGAEF
ncbi:hypothetical protein [Arthrobacter sp. MMS18-M83]|uniref:hypothetical protein n=1 Tax=Arthrobacter sp. MMS18-M83 TaxID=2996261 RepID=UPI00227ABD14|nr:hypothetical protein [Arthrobacter sp. MMS18-M83]WAH97781.1 hypothetical protein OW521_02460 [Arthrobacter sp. MMS18-M83]